MPCHRNNVIICDLVKFESCVTKADSDALVSITTRKLELIMIRNTIQQPMLSSVIHGVRQFCILWFKIEGKMPILNPLLRTDDMN